MAGGGGGSETMGNCGGGGGSSFWPIGLRGSYDVRDWPSQTRPRFLFFFPYKLSSKSDGQFNRNRRRIPPSHCHRVPVAQHFFPRSPLLCPHVRRPASALVTSVLDYNNNNGGGGGQTYFMTSTACRFDGLPLSLLFLFLSVIAVDVLIPRYDFLPRVNIILWRNAFSARCLVHVLGVTPTTFSMPPQ